jgi:4-hydroxy-3-methylbut-2-enyl diphosphate reductase
MKIYRAETLGMCFGVRDALKIAEGVVEPAQVTIYGQLVHNETLLVELGRRGFAACPEDKRVLPTTDTVLITAHGISDAERGRLEAAGKQLIDTTCPLVRRVHQAVAQLARDRFHVLVLGRRTHVEVRGIIEDLRSFDVIESVEQVRSFPHERLGIVCQTTMPPWLVRRLLERIHADNPGREIRFVDTVCQPTRDRQRALDELLPLVDALVVVGGRHSNNTRELVARSMERGVATYHVQGPADLDPLWFRNCNAVGLTAGTSTLDRTIDEVHEALAKLARWRTEANQEAHAVRE